MMENIESKPDENPKFEWFISPWVLPNERIMIQIKWEHDFTFTHINVKLPKEMIFVESINLSNQSLNDHEITILKSDIIHREEKITFPNYFCIILKFQSLNFPNLAIFKNIPINFLNNEIVVHKISPIAKIFRPLLKNKEPLDIVTLTDEKGKYNISINLESKGFGNISTSTVLDINSIEFNADSNISERVISRLKEKCDENDFYKKFDIKTEDIDTLIEKMKKLKKMKKLRFDQFKISEIFDNMKSAIILLDFIMEIVSEINISNKTETVKLKTPTILIPKSKFNEKIIFMKMKLFYSDILENKYAPVEIFIPITDLRRKIENTNIDFRINIMNIDDKTFENVEEVKIND